jgi:hypothetical protein
MQQRGHKERQNILELFTVSPTETAFGFQSGILGSLQHQPTELLGRKGKAAAQLRIERLPLAETHSLQLVLRDTSQHLPTASTGSQERLV